MSRHPFLLIKADTANAMVLLMWGKKQDKFKCVIRIQISLCIDQ